MADMELLSTELPSNITAEQVVLGSILVENQLLTKVLEKDITPDHFSINMHSGIFAVMQSLYIASKEPNVVLVMEECLKQNVFPTQDEAKRYLMALTDKSIESESLDSYCKVLDDKYLLRLLITATKDIYGKATEAGEEPDKVLDYAEKKIYDIRSDKNIRGLEPISPVLRETLKELAYYTEHPEEKARNGMSSGFQSLDNAIHGLNPGALIVIAARPGMGKTSFAMNIAVNAARINPDKKVAVFNLEMTREQLVLRMLSSEGRISSDDLQKGRIEPSRWKDLRSAAEMLNSVKIYVDDNSLIGIGEMKAKLRRLDGLGLVVIDYLQLMSTGRRDGNRVSEVSELTRNLKIMAKDLNVPVIVLSQLSRGSEGRTDKRPMLQDLRDSGSIEQDADVVIFLYRDAYYTKNQEDMSSCECIVAKNRNGEVPTLNLRWDGLYTRFSDVEQRYEQ